MSFSIRKRPARPDEQPVNWLRAGPVFPLLLGVFGFGLLLDVLDGLAGLLSLAWLYVSRWMRQGLHDSALVLAKLAGFTVEHERARRD